MCSGLFRLVQHFDGPSRFDSNAGLNNLVLFYQPTSIRSEVNNNFVAKELTNLLQTRIARLGHEESYDHQAYDIAGNINQIHLPSKLLKAVAEGVVKVIAPTKYATKPSAMPFAIKVVGRISAQ